MRQSVGKLYFRQVEAGDIAHIAENLRYADRQELIAIRGDGVSFADAISRGVLLSSHTWVGVEDGEPITIFGVASISLLGGVGSPWFLSTERIYDHPRTLVKEGKRYLAEMCMAYSELFNYVDARNYKSICWLKRLGFTLHPASAYGASGKPFHKFEIRSASDVSSRQTEP